MEIRKRITSREAYLIKFSRFTARMRMRMQLPMKTKLSLRSQKKRVPNSAMEKMDIMRDWFSDRSSRQPEIPKLDEIKSNRTYRLTILLKPLKFTFG
jgi:hypothetical protein